MYTAVKCDILGCSLFVAAADVVEVHNEPGFVFADHLSYFALINALVLLEKGKSATTTKKLSTYKNMLSNLHHTSGPLFL